MGAGLLIEWLYEGWRKLPLQDFIIVAVIVAVIGSVGIASGVAVGVGVAMAIFVLSYSRVRVIRQELTGTDYRSNVDRSPWVLEALQAQGHLNPRHQARGLHFLRHRLFGADQDPADREPTGGPMRRASCSSTSATCRRAISSATLAFSKIRNLLRPQWLPADPDPHE